MRWLILMMSAIVAVQCRPQTENPQSSGSTVEFISFPNGLRFPIWLSHPTDQIQYFGHQNIPLIFTPKNNFFLHNFLQPFTEVRQQHHTANNNKDTDELETSANSNFNRNSLTSGFRRKENDDEEIADFILASEGGMKNKPKITSVGQIVKVSNFSSQKKPLLTQIDQSEKVPLKKPSSLAPYRLHPLFHYLKNKNTIQKNRVIRFRNNKEKIDKDITTLILKPVAKSVAGVDGKAISTPLSKAVLRQGTNVDILFEPEAVAIAGPGGVAHAESDLEITYEDV